MRSRSPGGGETVVRREFLCRLWSDRALGRDPLGAPSAAIPRERSHSAALVLRSLVAYPPSPQTFGRLRPATPHGSGTFDTGFFAKCRLPVPGLPWRCH